MAAGAGQEYWESERERIDGLLRDDREAREPKEKRRAAREAFSRTWVPRKKKVVELLTILGGLVFLLALYAGYDNYISATTITRTGSEGGRIVYYYTGTDPFWAFILWIGSAIIITALYFGVVIGGVEAVYVLAEKAQR